MNDGHLGSAILKTSEKRTNYSSKSNQRKLKMILKCKGYHKKSHTFSLERGKSGLSNVATKAMSNLMRKDLLQQIV